MGEVLGIGVSHYPQFSQKPEDMSVLLRMRLKDPGVPDEVKAVESWPDEMREEWSDDFGARAGERHRQRMLVGLRKTKEALDRFKPDFVVIWGDDQYENFKEDVIPAFCILAYDDLVLRPWAQAQESAMTGGKPNVWNEPADREFLVKGHRAGAKYLATELLKRDFDVAYAYKQLHHKGMPHAFLNAILYMDYDRKGFPYPVVPFQINCYGDRVVSYRGFISDVNDRRELDPPSPSPSPQRVFDLGAEVARICKESPYRVALIASSSWSHAFMVDKTWRMRPDIPTDRRLYKAMVEKDYGFWRDFTLAQIGESGEQELLNWFALLGAMNELGHNCTWSDFVQTHVFNSSKVAAVFAPPGFGWRP